MHLVAAYFDRNESKLLSAFGNADVAPLARLEAYFDDRIEAFRTTGYSKGCLLGNLTKSYGTSDQTGTNRKRNESLVTIASHLSRHGDRRESLSYRKV